MTQDKVASMILEVIKANELLNQEQISYFETIKDQGGVFISSLDQAIEGKIDIIKNFCIDNKLFTKEDFEIFIKPVTKDIENNNRNIESEENIEEEQLLVVTKEDNSLEDNSLQIEKSSEENMEDKSSLDNKEDLKKGKYLTEEKIKQLIKDGKNLYKSIPGDKIPRDDNIFYAKTQLYRFIDSKASDFIIETQKRDGKIQYRIIFKINGENELQDLSKWARPEDNSKSNDHIFFETVRRYIGSSLGRITADLKHVMQDGSFSLDYAGKMRDFRLNSMPARCYGIAYPRYVQRLATEGDKCDFDSIKLLPHIREQYLEMINNRIAGTILVTGPTGSGKTTTIYSMLNKIDKDKFSVLSVEKPIESQLYGVNQTEVDAIERDDKKERYTNLEALRGILRQALDVVFIGEMRDSVEIIEGINTGLIGNKLITTLHTNSGVDTILRLISEGVNTNAIGNGVKYITAQRLVNSLCPHCSIEDPNKENNLKLIQKAFKRGQTFFHKEFKKVLHSLNEDEFNLDDLELIIRDKITFAYSNDLDLLIEEIEKNFKKIEKLKTKEEKIDILLELSKEYPYPEFRQKKLIERFKNANLKIANSKGCNHEDCRNGYSGRTVVVEILKMDKAIKSYIHKDIRLNDLESFLLNRGHRTMELEGYLLALDGIISVDKLKEFVE